MRGFKKQKTLLAPHPHPNPLPKGMSIYTSYVLRHSGIPYRWGHEGIAGIQSQGCESYGIAQSINQTLMFRNITILGSGFRQSPRAPSGRVCRNDA
jgi:hypothetical protein